MVNLNFSPDARNKMLNKLVPKLEKYYSQTEDLKVSSDWNIREIKAFTRAMGLEEGNKPQDVLDHVLAGLTNYAVHTPHPRYFGLFNPRTGFASILADLITATFNPQLAAWSHAPFANETESFVIKAFGQKFGYTKSSIDGTFCAGGAESNETALICCLNQFIPSYGESGIRGIERNPLIYASSESHHSIVKAAKRSGLGSQSVRVVSVNDNLQMDTEQLRGQIRKDRKDGFLPMMIIGTAGTTGAGAIDNLDALSRIASEENMWFHVDAAYGGAAILSKKISGSLVGIEKSDSITLDLHKWFSVPMGTSIFLTSHKKILHKSFGVKTRYMPKDGDPDKVTDPYLHSGQWSRRFIGLKIYLPLAIHGWQGYSEIIDKQISVGEGLKELLLENNWEIVNNTPLPIICFRKKEDRSGNEIVDLVQQVNDSGKAWLSVYPVKGKKTARICITNYDTGEKDIKDLIHLLNHYSQVSTI